MRAFDLSQYDINVRDIFRNASPAKLYEEAIRHEPGTSISSTGALIAYSGAKTGRSPKDKRVVKSPGSANEVWWGPVNFQMEDKNFAQYKDGVSEAVRAAGPKT
jgi:phosphoenolpyruvate carboxykinase (ATP)